MVNTLTAGGINLIETVLPKMLGYYLPNYIEQLLPGLADSHRENIARSCWSDIRNSDPAFKSLPDVDSPEFNELREKVLVSNPWLTEMTFNDENGNPLPHWHPRSVRLPNPHSNKLMPTKKTGPRKAKPGIVTNIAKHGKLAEKQTRVAAMDLGNPFR